MAVVAAAALWPAPAAAYTEPPAAPAVAALGDGGVLEDEYDDGSGILLGPCFDDVPVDDRADGWWMCGDWVEDLADGEVVVEEEPVDVPDCVLSEDGFSSCEDGATWVVDVPLDESGAPEASGSIG
ncbi:MAG: hypothetical protein ACRCSL_11870 [Microbacterium sp.]